MESYWGATLTSKKWPIESLGMGVAGPENVPPFIAAQLSHLLSNFRHTVKAHFLSFFLFLSFISIFIPKLTLSSPLFRLNKCGPLTNTTLAPSIVSPFSSLIVLTSSSVFIYHFFFNSPPNTFSFINQGFFCLFLWFRGCYIQRRLPHRRSRRHLRPRRRSFPSLSYASFSQSQLFVRLELQRPYAPLNPCSILEVILLFLSFYCLGYSNVNGFVLTFIVLLFWQGSVCAVPEEACWRSWWWSIEIWNQHYLVQGGHFHFHFHFLLVAIIHKFEFLWESSLCDYGLHGVGVCCGMLLIL